MHFGLNISAFLSIPLELSCMITHMVFILAASSLHHAIQTSITADKRRYKDQIYCVPGSGTFRHQPFGRQYGVGHMGDKSVDQIG